MRGHIGFRIPRYPKIRDTQFALDLLQTEYAILQKTKHVTQLAIDQLNYSGYQLKPIVSQVNIDVLTYNNT